MNIFIVLEKHAIVTSTAETQIKMLSNELL